MRGLEQGSQRRRRLARPRRPIVSFEPINGRVLTALPEPKIIARLGVGFDEIDAAAMQTRAIYRGHDATARSSHATVLDTLRPDCALLFVPVPGRFPFEDR